jgi:hypothetical protein
VMSEDRAEDLTTKFGLIHKAKCNTRIHYRQHLRFNRVSDITRHMEDDALFQLDERGPGGSPLIVLRCPCCDYPVAVRPDISASCTIENGLLSLRQVVACPAHWPRVDDSGNVDVEVATGRPPRISCPWKVIIFQGRAHHTKCRAVSRIDPGPCECDKLWRKR